MNPSPLHLSKIVKGWEEDIQELHKLRQLRMVLVNELQQRDSILSGKARTAKLYTVWSLGDNACENHTFIDTPFSSSSSPFSFIPNSETQDEEIGTSVKRLVEDEAIAKARDHAITDVQKALLASPEEYLRNILQHLQEEMNVSSPDQIVPVFDQVSLSFLPSRSSS